MKAILIFPGITIPGFNSFGSYRSVDANYIAHGLASISAYAKTNGHEIDLIDLRKLKNWNHFEKIIQAKNPNIAGIGFMSVDYEPAIQAANIIKRLNKKTKIIVGGVHPTIATEEIKRDENIDFIIKGEGEITFSKILFDLEQGKDIPRVLEGEPPDLNNIPWVDRDLFDYRGELRTPFVSTLKKPFVTINISRGCPFRCTFCQPAERSVFGGKVKRRSVINVIGELLYLKKKYNFRSFLIHDDLFLQNITWVEEFINAYKTSGFTQEFICQLRADMICKNEKLIKKLAGIGMTWAMVGFESGSQRVLDFLKKDVIVGENIKASEILKQNKVKIFANYMFGIPTETKDEVWETVKMIRLINPEHHSPTFFTPYPGSHLYDYIMDNNLSLMDTYKKYDRSTASGDKIKGVDYKFLREVINDLIPKKRFPQLRNIVKQSLKHIMR